MVIIALIGLAHAQALSVSPALDVSGGDLLPGLRLGYEPAPAAAIELSADSDFDHAWHGGLALAGRWWLSRADYSGEGLFLVGRVTAGATGRAGEVSPWTGVSGGFGVRPVSALHIEATFGPEWGGGARWRTGLALGGVFNLERQGGGSIWRHPRPIPGA